MCPAASACASIRRIYAGYRIPPYYDSLIGKLIVFGKTRTECLMRLRRALGEYVIEGIETTIPLFQRLVREPDIIDGHYDIHWLETLSRAATPECRPSRRRSCSRPMPPASFRWRRVPRTTRSTGSSPRSAASFPLDGLHVSHSLRKRDPPAPFDSPHRHRVPRRHRCLRREDAGPQDDLDQRRHPSRSTASCTRWAAAIRSNAGMASSWSAGFMACGSARAFFGESMFSRETDASKVALVHLVARLNAGGFRLLDAQFMTPHLESLGARTIGRADYHAAARARHRARCRVLPVQR